MIPQLRSFEQLLDEYLENPEFAAKFLNQALCASASFVSLRFPVVFLQTSHRK